MNRDSILKTTVDYWRVAGFQFRRSGEGKKIVVKTAKAPLGQLNEIHEFLTHLLIFFYVSLDFKVSHRAVGLDILPRA